MNNELEESKILKDIEFQSLTPTDDASNHAVFKALDFAVKKENNIHNVAVTGNYGSGKSSVLLTYIKEKGKEKRTEEFLNISLATFEIKASPNNQKVQKEELPISKSTEDNNPDSANNDSNSEDRQIPESTINELEKSILQQIFYKKSSTNFPFSRFKRIKNISPIKIILKELALLIIGLFILFCFKPNYFFAITTNIFKDGNIPKIIFGCFAYSCMLLSLYFIIRSFSKIKLNKFIFNKTEFGLDEISDESLLNKYLDEILYFFETTKYKYVIFEDLDRFENPEIFIKLRELNNIINNYEPVQKKGKVVFIYALKDDIFEDLNRTKFFDFIIPVIPVINNQNSMDKLLEKQNENPNTALAKLDKEFLQDIGLYIDDMRLLLNCINEFKIYDEIINEEDYTYLKPEIEKTTVMNRNKIFAIILYKNLYPKDFSDLLKNEGILYSIFQKKDEFIKKEKEKLEQQIQVLDEEITKSKEYVQTSIKNLNRTYLFAFMETIQGAYYIPSNLIDSYLTEDGFNNLIKQQKITVYYYGNNYSTTRPFYIEHLEAKVDKEVPYAQKLKYVKEKSGNYLTNQKYKLEKQKNEQDKIYIKEMDNLLDLVNDCIKEHSNVNKDFITYLLRNGWIDENYSDYISYFYQETLKQNDRNFLRLLKDNKEPIFTLELTNTDIVVKRIRKNEWHNEAILNNDLIKRLIETKNEHLPEVIEVLCDYEANGNKNSFFKQLNINNIKNVANFYEYLNREIDTSNKNYNTFFDESNYDMLFYFFKSINSGSESSFCNFLKQNLPCLYINFSKEEGSIIKNQLLTMKLKFNLEKNTCNYPIFNLILDTNSYYISKENLTLIINNLTDNKDEITNFITIIEKLENQNIRTYLNQDINLTINELLYPLGNKLNENEENLINLLQGNTVTDENKKWLIENNQTKIHDLSVFSKELPPYKTGNPRFPIWNILLENNCVVASWANLFSYIKANRNSLNETVKSFLEYSENIDSLSQEKPLSDEELQKTEELKYIITKHIFDFIINCNDISDNSYKKIMDICPFKDILLQEFNLNDNKIKAIISSHIFEFTEKNYITLSSKNEKMLTFFIKNNLESFLSLYDKHCVLPIHLHQFITSPELTNDEKNKILSTNFITWPKFTNEMLPDIADFIIKNNYIGHLHIDFSKCVDALQKDKEKIISLINTRITLLSEHELQYSLNVLGNEYTELIKTGASNIKLMQTQYNIELCKNLKIKGYISSYNEK